MTHYPETGTKNRYQKTCTGFLRVCHAIRYDFFWYRNLVLVRALHYSVKETGTGFLVPVSSQCVMSLRSDSEDAQRIFTNIYAY